MTHIEKANDLFGRKFHCSQAVFAAFAEELGLTEEQALKIGAHDCVYLLDTLLLFFTGLRYVSLLSYAKHQRYCPLLNRRFDVAFVCFNSGLVKWLHTGEVAAYSTGFFKEIY